VTPAEIEMLTSYFGSSVDYLEFGSGASTLLALRHGVGRCNTVETDQKWIDKLREAAGVREAERTGQLKFHYVNIGPVGEWGRPLDRSSMGMWPDYFLKIWARRSPELVLIDGRFRVATALCAMMAHSLIILMHDFDRPNYAVLHQFADITQRVDSLVMLTRKRGLSDGPMLAALADVWTDYW
jgi:hypothetical protein